MTAFTDLPIELVTKFLLELDVLSVTRCRYVSFQRQEKIWADWLNLQGLPVVVFHRRQFTGIAIQAGLRNSWFAGGRLRLALCGRALEDAQYSSERVEKTGLDY